MAFKVRTRVIVLSILALLLISAAATSYYLLNQPKWVADTALFFLKKSSPSNLVFKEITIESLRWDHWQNLSLENIRIKCKVNGESYFISAGQVRLEHLSALLSAEPLLVDVSHMVLVADSLNVSDLQLQAKIYLKSLRYDHADASFYAARVESNQYVLDDLRADVADHHGELTVTRLIGRCYGGALAVQGKVGYLKPQSYRLDIQLKEISSSLLAQANPNFGQLNAVVNGDVKIQDDKGRGLMLQADLKAPSGGSMKASLLRYLAQYVPQRKQVEDLIRQDANVQLNKAQMTILSVDPEKISSEVILNSSSLNLNMDVKFDINIEGGIDGFLAYIHQ